MTTSVEGLDYRLCFGCGVCEVVCPVACISFFMDDGGFVVPIVDSEVCVSCGVCVQTCPAMNLKEVKAATRKPQLSFEAQHRDNAILLRSASGGAFTALARAVLAEGGVVYGCASIGTAVRHIRVDDDEGLAQLQGSKYVQSRIDGGGVWKNFQIDVVTAKPVLFSGTPCQVAAARRVSGDAENLLTVDLICHGAGAPRLFSKSIDDIEQKNGCKVLDIRFRTKIDGWGLLGSITTSKDDLTKTHPYHHSLYPYYYSSGDIYRECCYRYPFACDNRMGVFKVEDFWGVEQARLRPASGDWSALIGGEPTSLTDAGIDERKGISAVLANNPERINVELWRILKGELILLSANFKDVAKENCPLNAPLETPSREGRIHVRLPERCANTALLQKKMRCSFC